MEPDRHTPLPSAWPAVVAAVAGLLAVGASSPAAAQDVPDVAGDVPGALAGLDAANARAWTGPLLRSVMPSLTAGFFTSGGRGESFQLAVGMTAGRTPSEDGTFTPVLPSTVTFEGVVYEDPYAVLGGGSASPTVAGEGPGLLLAPRPGSDFEAALDAAGVAPDARSLRLPPGLDVRRSPVPLVEASIAFRGLGVQLVGRFSPTLELFDEVGDVSTFGGGVLLTVSRFLPLEGVVDMGVSATTQKLRAADWLDVSASAVGLVVSRRVGPLRPWLHGTVGWTSAGVTYAVHNPDAVPLLPADGTPVRFTVHENGRARIALGASLALSLLEVSGEYQAGERDVVSLRLTLLRR